MTCTLEVGHIGAYINIRWMKSDRYEISTDRRPFLPTVMNEVEKRRGLTSNSTLENELTAIRSFVRFAGKGITMDDITPQLIGNYERWLIGKDIRKNTSACYLRSLRAVLNRCGKDGASLFRKVHTGTIRTEKRAVDGDTIRKIQNVPLVSGSFLAHARELYIFSIMAMGMPFIDLAHLRKSDVRDGSIIYYRHKTGRRVKVGIEPAMQDILTKYSDPSSPYLFPFLKTSSEREYRSLLSRYNHALARISVKAGMKKKLTSYTARHTWASMAYRKGVPLAVISKALGHSSPVMTQTYLKEVDDNAIMQANRVILREFNCL